MISVFATAGYRIWKATKTISRISEMSIRLKINIFFHRLHAEMILDWSGPIQ
jgi:hypothetical protein